MCVCVGGQLGEGGYSSISDSLESGPCLGLEYFPLFLSPPLFGASCKSRGGEACDRGPLSSECF